MQRAIELGRCARYWSAPNPPVGCVLVRDDQEIGAGFTQPAGQAHAEVMALNAAGDVNGATAYVTLEPCSHQGQTGPCASALIDAGVTRVVVAVEDPNPQVAGSGIAALRAEGAEAVLSLSSVTGAGVTQMLRRLIGIIEDAVAEENRPEEEQWSP